MPKRILLAPTLFTPHLSRRYSLLVQIKVAGNGKASFRLEVPVQIVYQKEPIGTGGLHGESPNTSRELNDQDHSRQILGVNAVAELPIYVP